MARETSASAPVGAGRVVLRLVAIVLGSYAASAALVAAGTTTLPLLGMARSDAFTVSGALGFLIYLVLALWAAAERRLTVLIATLLVLTAGGAAVAASISLMGKP